MLLAPLLLLAQSVSARLKNWDLLGKVVACKGQALERVAFHHPFYDRLSPVYLGDYVTLDTGTGIVHFGASLRRGGLPVPPSLRHEG